jgi:uncharacterized phage-associated protein
MNARYGALDVSRYVICYSNERDYDISSLKLQKLLYFIQAWFLLKSQGKRRCFREDIEAWDFGPVVPEVFYRYIGNASMNIPSFTPCSVIASIALFSDDDCALIRSVVDFFSSYAATQLTAVIHGQQPWIDAYREGPKTVISPEAIWRYFAGSSAENETH